MVYSTNGFYFLIGFIVLFILSLFLRKYKVINLILPYKKTFSLFSIINFLFLFLIAVLIAIIPFNIGIYQGTKIVKKPSLNIEVLFDVSLSMVAKDFKPDRFDVAKQSLIDFLNSLDVNYNIGLITFSGKPFVYIPITNHKKSLIWKIENMKMSDFPPALDFVGTAIGDAIILGTKKLLDYTDNKDKPGVIILFTDGDSNKGVDPKQAIEYAKKYNIPIFVGAIGKDKTYIVGKDYFGNDVPTSIDLPTLKYIAKQTGGEFLQIKSKEDFLNILSNLYSYVKTYERTEKIDEYFFINYYLKWVLVVLLILYIFFIRFSFTNNKL